MSSVPSPLGASDPIEGREEGFSDSTPGDQPSTSDPRPIPQAHTSYTRPQLRTHSSGSSPNSSSVPSEVGSSSNASSQPIDLAGRTSRDAISRVPTPPNPASETNVPSDGRPSSSSRAPSRQSTPPPPSSDVPPSILPSTSGLLLGSSTQPGMLSIAPPKRNFATTPSFPSPLARASIVPTRTSDDEEEDVLDADVEQTSLEPTEAVIPEEGRGFRATSKRRTSSVALLGTSPRATSPNALMQLIAGRPPPTAASPTVSASSSVAGSPTDINALGLMTQSVRKERQMSDSSWGRSDNSSPSTSPNRMRRRSEYIGALASSGAVRHPSLAIPTTSPGKHVSPLNPLPPPWAPSSQTSSSLSASPDSSAAQRLNRIPTSVRLATDLLSSSPSLNSGSMSAGVKPPTEMFAGLSLSAPRPMPHVGSFTVHGSTPLSTEPHSPSDAGPMDSKMATPHPSPSSDAADLSASPADAMSSSWISSSSASKPRLSVSPMPPMPPSSFNSSSFNSHASANHHRYRTSVHESAPHALPSILRPSTSRASFHDSPSMDSGSSANALEGAEETARHIVASRWAKRQTWGVNHPHASMPENPRSKSSSLIEAVDLTPSLERPFMGYKEAPDFTSSPLTLATPQAEEPQWVNWMDEHKQNQEAKARAEMESFSMPLKSTAPEVSSTTGSPSTVTTDSPKLGGSPLSGEPHFPSDSTSTATSNPAGASGHKHGHIRSLSLRSSLGKGSPSSDASKSSPQKVNVFASHSQSRTTSGSSFGSRDSIDRPRKNIGAKIDGWWKSVVGNIGNLSTPVIKTSHTTSTHHLPLLKPTLPQPPPLAAGPTSSVPPVIGFRPAANPVPAAPSTSLKHATSLHEIAGSSPSPIPPPVRPTRAHTDEVKSSNTSVASRPSNETIARSYSQEPSLDARRRQPPLHLRLAQGRPSTAPLESPSGFNLNTEKAARQRPPVRPIGSRSSSYGTTDESPHDSSRHLRTVSSAWGQSPGALFDVLPDDPSATPPMAYDDPAITSRDFNTSAVHRALKEALTQEKATCDKKLRQIIHQITLFIEDKLNEASNMDVVEPPQPFSPSLLPSAMDSQSDFGVDDLERIEPPAMRRRTSSRPASRRPSISLPPGSPARRLEALPPNEFRSPGRRRPSGAVIRPQIDQRTPRQPFLDDAISSSTSRSTSRSRSPYPGQTHDVHPTTDDQTLLPKSFLAIVQSAIDIATEVLDTSISTFMAKPGSCQEYVQKLIDIRGDWEANPEWPGRDWYGSMLYAVSKLGLAVVWWQEEKVFWNFADEGTENAEPLTFVLRPPLKAKPASVSSPPPSSYKRPPPAALGIELNSAISSTPPVYPSVEEVLDEHHDGEKTATLVPAPEVHELSQDLEAKVDLAKRCNLVMELELDGDTIRWVNPAWAELVGGDPSDPPIGRQLHAYLAPPDVSAVSEPSRALIEEEDEQHTISARFRLQSASPVNDASKTQWELGTKFRTMVGTGLLMHGLNAEPSHFMWAIKPEGLVLSELVQQQEDADAEEDERVAEEQEEEAAAGLRPGPPETPQPGPRFHSRLVTQPVTPFPTSSLINTQILLCRICEREVPTWYFEKHSETCHEIHRLEADISEQNDKVSEILQEAETLLAMYDPQDRSPTPTYRGTAVTSRMQNALPLSPEKYRQAQHAAQRNLIEQVIDTLRLCLEISTPSLKDENSDLPIDEQRLLSPRSENHLSALSIWSRPTTEDEALTRLIDDSLLVTRGKINAVNRLRNTVVYSERVRHEWQEKVERGLQQAEQEALGEGSDETSSGEESAHTAEEGVNLASTQTLPPAEPMSSGLHLMVPGMSADTSSSTSPSDVAGGDGPPRLSRHHRRLSSRTDYTDFSTSPSLPSSFPAEASPTRRRRKTSGRLSVGSETPLSPRLPCITPASRSTTITIKDFEMLKPISKGAFGSVYLARKKVTGDFYAIKILRKADMISKNQITNVKAERKILMTQSESPYVVRLFFTFQNKHFLFLVMEYLPGGDLAALVKMIGPLGEDWTRRFIAEVVLGLEALHSKGVVHRDLKPDNLLIDAHGHLKLTDFGLSKVGLLGRQAGGSRFTIPRGRARSGQHLTRQERSHNKSIDSTESPAFSPSSQPSGSNAALSQSSYFNDGRQSADDSSGSDYAPRHRRSQHHASFGVSLNTALGLKSLMDSENTPPISETHKFVGTVDYVAPESILGLGGDNEGVDWWALGVVMYEFMYGAPPFNDDSAEKVFANITSRRIFWPEDDDDIQTSPQARDLMERLMCSDPARRLGARGVDEIKNHPFFEEIDWDHIMDEDGPFVPQPTTQDSTDYFDARGLTDLPDELEPILASINPSAAAEHGMESLLDDFGAFNFRNLAASKAANDEVLQSIKTAEQALVQSEPPSAGLNLDRRKSSLARRTSRGPWVDQRMQNPPSPSTSTSSSASNTFSAATQPWQHHSRRTSDMDRVRDEADLSRRSSLPSRLRASSTSAQSFDSTPLLLSPPSSVSSPYSPSQDTTLSKVQVLLAEDNPVSAKVARNVLSKMGMEVAFVSSGTDAIAVATTCPFDLIFVDVMLSEINGSAVAQYLRSVTGPNTETPIVAVTAPLGDDQPVPSEEGTVYAAVIGKPFTRDGVRAVLRKLGFIEQPASAR